MCFSPAVFRRLDFLEFSIPFGFYIFPSSSSAGFLESEGEGFDGGTLLRTVGSRPLTLHIVWLWLSIFVLTCCRSKRL